MIDESTLLELPPRKRGRPSAAMLAEEARLRRVIEQNRQRLKMSTSATAASHGILPMSDNYDEAVLKDIQYRFDMLERYTMAAAMGNIRCLVVAGAPGVGKTYNVEKLLTELIPEQHEVFGGADITPVHLYMAAYRNREEGSVIVFDDSDGVFRSEECMNIMKRMTDSSAVRRLMYPKASPILEDEGIPNEFEFKGTVIFLSNKNLEAMVEKGDRMACHIEALMSRGLFLSLRIHDVRHLYLWVRYKATETVFQSLHATPEEQSHILDFLDRHYAQFRKLSLRAIEQMLTAIRTNPVNWQKDVTILLLK